MEILNREGFLALVQNDTAAALDGAQVREMPDEKVAVIPGTLRGRGEKIPAGPQILVAAVRMGRGIVVATRRMPALAAETLAAMESKFLNVPFKNFKLGGTPTGCLWVYTAQKGEETYNISMIKVPTLMFTGKEDVLIATGDDEDDTPFSVEIW